MGKPKRTCGESQGNSSDTDSSAATCSGSIGFGCILREDLANSKKGVQSIVKKWITDMNTGNKDAGEYALVELVFSCAGYERAITPAMVRYDLPKLIDTMTNDDYCDEYGDFPLLSRKSKLRARRIAEFISELFAQCKSSLVLYDGILVKNFSSFLKSAAQSGYKNLRHTAVYFAMKFLTELRNIEIEEQMLLNQYAEDLDDDPTCQSQQEKSVLEAHVKDMKLHQKYLTSEIFATAFRDKVERIQLLCIHEMGVWVQKTSQLLLRFGKYIFQAMIETAAVIRIKVLEIVEGLLETMQDHDMADAGVLHFFEVALGKVLRVTLDVSVEAAVLAVHLIKNILKVFPLLELSPTDLRKVNNLVYSARQPVAFAAGLFLYTQLQVDKKTDLVVQLAQFHNANCRDHPNLFPEYTAEFLVLAMPPDCKELTDWDGMVDTAENLLGETDLLPFLVIVAAAVKQAISRKNPTRGAPLPEQQRERITNAFLPFIFFLMEDCIDPVELEICVWIVSEMDLHILCDSRNKEASNELVTEVEELLLRYPEVHTLAKACTIVLGKLSMAKHPLAIDTIKEWPDYMAAMVEGIVDDNPQGMENALSLIVAFSPVLSLPEERHKRFLEVVQTIATDISTEMNKWSMKSHGYAIEFMHYEFAWHMVQGKREEASQTVSCLLKSVLEVLSRNRHPQDITLMVMAIGLDTIHICDQLLAESFNEASELLLQLSSYMQKYILLENEDAVQMPLEIRREMAVRFFKLVVVGQVSPGLSGVFYKTYNMMGMVMQKTIAELHVYLWRENRWFPSLCVTMLAGLKEAFIDLFKAADGREQELADGVAQLAGLAATVSSWLALGKNANRVDAENRGRELGKVCAAHVEDCARSPQIMTDFCFVIAPFAAKLPDPVKRQMIKLIRKTFAGKLFAGVRDLVNKLKMKNVEIAKLPVGSVNDSDSEVAPSPIANRSHSFLASAHESYGSLSSPGEESSSLVSSANALPAGPNCCRLAGRQRLAGPEPAGRAEMGDGAGSSGVGPVQPRQKIAEPQRRRLKPLGHSTLIGQQLQPNARPSLAKGKTGLKAYPSTLEPIFEVRTSGKSNKTCSSGETGAETPSVSAARAVASLGQDTSVSGDTDREKTDVECTRKSGSSAPLEANECYSSPGIGGSPPSCVTTAASLVQGLSGGSSHAHGHSRAQLKCKGTKLVAHSTPNDPNWSKERPEPTGLISGLAPIVETRTSATNPSFSINTSTPKMVNPGAKPHSLRPEMNSAESKSAMHRDDREKIHPEAGATSLSLHDNIDLTSTEQGSASSTSASTTPATSAVSSQVGCSRAKAARGRFHRKGTKPVACSTLINQRRDPNDDTPDQFRVKPRPKGLPAQLMPVTETCASDGTSTSDEGNNGRRYASE